MDRRRNGGCVFQDMVPTVFVVALGNNDTLSKGRVMAGGKGQVMRLRETRRGVSEKKNQGRKKKVY